jgi:hypothetical protein
MALSLLPSFRHSVSQRATGAPRRVLCSIRTIPPRKHWDTLQSRPIRHRHAPIAASFREVPAMRMVGVNYFLASRWLRALGAVFIVLLLDTRVVFEHYSLEIGIRTAEARIHCGSRGRPHQRSVTHWGPPDLEGSILSLPPNATGRRLERGAHGSVDRVDPRRARRKTIISRSAL